MYPPKKKQMTSVAKSDHTRPKIVKFSENTGVSSEDGHKSSTGSIKVTYSLPECFDRCLLRKQRVTVNHVVT
jgi:hypothetical protein